MRKDRNKKRKIVIISVILLFFIFLGFYYFCVVSPIIKTYSSAEMKSITEKAINLAVSNVVNRTLSYDKLIDITYNSHGEIDAFSANQYEINSITREIIKESQYQISNLTDNNLHINLGTFTGVPFFVGKGPKISLRFMPIGDVSGKFSSEFNSVGINMTKHSLFLYVDVHVTVVLPVSAYEVHSSNQVLLAESIIVGKVPQVYFNSDAIGKNLNLIP